MTLVFSILAYHATIYVDCDCIEPAFFGVDDAFRIRAWQTLLWIWRGSTSGMDLGVLVLPGCGALAYLGFESFGATAKPRASFCSPSRDLRALARLDLIGIFCGGACLINPSLTLVVPFFLIYLGYRWKTKNKAFASRLAVSAAALILTVTPWLFRNYVVLGRICIYQVGSASPTLLRQSSRLGQ